MVVNLKDYEAEKLLKGLIRLMKSYDSSKDTIVYDVVRLVGGEGWKATVTLIGQNEPIVIIFFGKITYLAIVAFDYSVSIDKDEIYKKDIWSRTVFAELFNEALKLVRKIRTDQLKSLEEDPLDKALDEALEARGLK